MSQEEKQKAELGSGLRILFHTLSKMYACARTSGDEAEAHYISDCALDTRRLARGLSEGVEPRMIAAGVQTLQASFNQKSIGDDAGNPPAPAQAGEYRVLGALAGAIVKNSGI